MQGAINNRRDGSCCDAQIKIQADVLIRCGGDCCCVRNKMQGVSVIRNNDNVDGARIERQGESSARRGVVFCGALTPTHGVAVSGVMQICFCSEISGATDVAVARKSKYKM